MSVPTILHKVISFDVSHVVITGGEPMLPTEIVDVCRGLKKAGLHITIETAGTIFRDVECDLFSISPKLSNSTPKVAEAEMGVEQIADNPNEANQGRSGVPLRFSATQEIRDRHEKRRLRPEIVDQLIGRRDYQLKFVVEKESDMPEILDYLGQLKTFDHERVYLMPEGIDQQTLNSRQEWLEPICRSHGFLFCSRMHIQWYGNKRGT